MTMLLIAGEDIPAESSVVKSLIDGKAYGAGIGVMGYYIGHAAENLREGFRVAASPAGEVREDDA